MCSSSTWNDGSPASSPSESDRSLLSVEALLRDRELDFGFFFFFFVRENVKYEHNFEIICS